MQIEKIQLEVGPYKAFAVPTGDFGLDGGAMFGTVPRVLWERTNPPDELNRITLEARGLLLVSENRKILVDTGNGGDFTEKYGERLGSKFSDIYGMSPKGSSRPTLTKSLAKLGYSTSDITDVILTHLHFDHAGGATKWDGNKLIPTFENAAYYVQSENLKTAQNPNVREKASYFSANFQPLIDAGVVKFVDGNKEILPGIFSWVSNGHTKAHQVIQVRGPNKNLFYCGDVVPTSSHVRLPFIMGYDLEPLTIIEEKRKLLGEAADIGAYLFFEHDPKVDVALVERAGEDFKLKHVAVLESETNKRA
ncbi:MAG: MBL fold metallo-hydrolase [Bdellovibrionales bacterium CG10_big_fil_rev_8_21_14_0_10_45_34]|nr:MAG: MBL fold metallo-hydrolase [Bdellovibrionales bacterium CG10_big_fil_rev_8_21_14_0_10_45_34]